MNKSQLIKLTDLTLFLGFLLLISTGLLMKYVLPPGSGQDMIWSLSRHGWGDVHFYIAAIFLAVLCLHLFLHTKFIRSALVGKNGGTARRVWLLAIVAIVILLVVFAPLFSVVEYGAGGGHGGGRGSGGGVHWEQRHNR